MNSVLRIHTDSRTYWDDCGWGDLRHGHRVLVRVYRDHAVWIATGMQNWDDPPPWEMS